MKLTNTSRYPDGEVSRLLEFAMQDIDHSRLAVHVRNSSIAYRGRAYDGIPRVSSRHRNEDVDRLVTIGIGTPRHFPCNNLTSSVRWQPLENFEAYVASMKLRFEVRQRLDNRGRVRFERRAALEHPYGGLRSPLIEMGDWREALVSVGAHEARHIAQYQQGLRRSEVDAERAASAVLARFRTAEERALQPVATPVATDVTPEPVLLAEPEPAAAPRPLFAPQSPFQLQLPLAI